MDKKATISKTTKELVILVLLFVLSYAIFSRFDVLESIVRLSSKYESYEIDEIFSTFIALAFYLGWFAFRRWREMIDATNIIHKQNEELKTVLESIKTLEGIIPICMHCKGVRDDKGFWNKLEEYITEHSDAQFSHGICEECLKKFHLDPVEETNR